MRLFIAIPLPYGVKGQLSELTQPISGIRWQDYKQLHITLKFLGETEARQADELITALTSVRQTSFCFTINGFGYFPPGNHPRVLWAGVDNETPIINLQQSVEDKCVKVGFETESRSYKPHITLGKVKGASKNDVMAFINHHKPFRIPEIPVEEFVLYESVLSSDGATHKPYARFQLTNDKPGRSDNNEDF